MMGAGILGNNSGHYGAFGPAFGKGVYDASQNMRQNATAQSNMALQKAQLAQMPGDAAYKEAMAYRAMHPDKSKFDKQMELVGGDIKKWRSAFGPSAAVNLNNFGVPQAPTKVSLGVTERVLDTKLNLSKLSKEGKESIVSVAHGEVKALQQVHKGQKKPVPSDSESLDLILEDPNSELYKILNSKENRSLWEDMKAFPGETFDSAVSGVKGLIAPERAEGEEWVGEDGKNRKMINGVVNVQKGQ